MITSDKRQYIGLIGPEPVSFKKKPSGITHEQQALRETLIQQFSKEIIKNYIDEQKKYLNVDDCIVDAIKYLFDEHGIPPENAPLEDIVKERHALEISIRWIDALKSSLEKMLPEMGKKRLAKKRLGHKNTSSNMLWDTIRTRFKQEGLRLLDNYDISINANRNIMQIVQFIFEEMDSEHDVKAKLGKIKKYMNVLHSISMELKAHLLKIKEIEDSAFIYLERR